LGVFEFLHYVMWVTVQNFTILLCPL